MNDIANSICLPSDARKTSLAANLNWIKGMVEDGFYFTSNSLSQPRNIESFHLRNRERDYDFGFRHNDDTQSLIALLTSQFGGERHARQ